jgi:heptosyltransferase-2
MSSVLVFRSAALGDFILATPALAEVRKAFPAHRVVLLTIQSAVKEQREKVARYTGNSTISPWVELAMPHLIDEVVKIDNVNEVAYIFEIRRQLKNYHFDIVILMLDPAAPWLGRIKKLLLIYFLFGVLPVIGWRWPKALNFNIKNARKLKQQGQLKHHVHGPLQFLSELNPPRKYRDEELLFDLRPGHEADVFASVWLNEHGVTEDQRLVAVAPGSIQPHKRWPIESFKTLIKSILTQYTDVHIIVIGTPSDNALGCELVAIAPRRIHNLAGVTSIAQSAALLQRCDLLVGNDGGAIHLGDAMGCKVVSIVPGIEYPDSIEPWHNKELAIRHPVDCSPCYNFLYCPNGHNRCMNELPVEKVLASCITVLNQE